MTIEQVTPFFAVWLACVGIPIMGIVVARLASDD